MAEKKVSDWKRVTGFFKNKDNPAMMGGYVKGEQLQVLFDEVKKAVDNQEQLNITVWKNKEEGNKPIASMTVKAGPLYKKGADAPTAKSTAW